jgi:porcupine-like protein
MDASIGARKEIDGKRKHREGSTWVILVNLMFGLLTMFHLAYLGVMFDQSSPEQTTGYSWSHTLSKWRRLDYTSHYVVGGMAFVNWLL